MPSRTRATSSLAATLVLCMATVTLPASGTPDSGTAATDGAHEGIKKSDLQLVLRVDKSDLELEGDYRIEVALRNVSHEPIDVYRRVTPGGSGGVVLHIRDLNGRPVKGEFIRETLPFRPEKGDPYLFVRLEPAQFLGGWETGEVRSLVPTVGRFTIFAKYVCPLPQELYGTEQREPRTLWRETGVIESNAVTIDVR